MPQQDSPVALITGGARGQGAAHAAALAATGVRVVIADVRDDDGNATARALSEQQFSVRYTHLDVTDAAAWTQVVADIEDREGGLDVLVNNAGIIRVTPLTELEISEWDLLQRVNATSVLLGIKAVRTGIGPPRRRLDHQHRLHRRPPRSRWLRRVLRIQSGRSRPHPGGCTRTRPERHPGQLDQSRGCGYPDERRRASRRHILWRAARSSRHRRRDLPARRLPRLHRCLVRHRRGLPGRRRADDPMSSPGIALVTGASSGMGRSTTEAFLARGWTVLALDLTPAKINTAHGTIVPITVDVRDRAAVDSALAAHLPDLGGSIHAVANVAGIYPPSTLETVTAELFHRVFDVNVLGVINVMAAAVPHMPEGSAIVNFASVDGFAVSPGQLIYGASKAAVIMITKSTALELRPAESGSTPSHPDGSTRPATRPPVGCSPPRPPSRSAASPNRARSPNGSGSSPAAVPPRFMTGETITLSGGDVIR